MYRFSYIKDYQFFFQKTLYSYIIICYNIDNDYHYY